MKDLGKRAVQAKSEVALPLSRGMYMKGSPMEHITLEQANPY